MMEAKKTSVREVLTSVVFITVLGIFFAFNFLIPAPTLLEGERRAPEKFPEISRASILSGTFMNKFENFAADHFAFRETFRGFHSFIVLGLFRQSDKSGLYLDQNVGAGEFRRIDEEAFRQTAEKIKKAAISLSDLEMNIFYSIVPDKSVFAKTHMPGFYLPKAEGLLSQVLDDYQYISLISNLDADSFYKTDLHWNQAKIKSVANGLLMAMDAAPSVDEYPKVVAGEFCGVYAGQLALPMAGDTVTYADVSDLKVSYLNEKTLRLDPGPVYDADRFTGVDPYDVFLRGPQPLIVIENNDAPERELYLFRDSFGSSLAPLLTDSYSKITVIDLRYIHLSLLKQFISFRAGSDVLFLYSSQIFNNPSVLQVSM